MANSTFSGPIRSEGGFNVINKAAGTGAVTETGFSGRWVLMRSLIAILLHH